MRYDQSVYHSLIPPQNWHASVSTNSSNLALLALLSTPVNPICMINLSNHYSNIIVWTSSSLWVIVWTKKFWHIENRLIEKPFSKVKYNRKSSVVIHFASQVLCDQESISPIPVNRTIVSTLPIGYQFCQNCVSLLEIRLHVIMLQSFYKLKQLNFTCIAFNYHLSILYDQSLQSLPSHNCTNFFLTWITLWTKEFWCVENR